MRRGDEVSDRPGPIQSHPHAHPNHQTISFLWSTRFKQMVLPFIKYLVTRPAFSTAPGRVIILIVFLSVNSSKTEKFLVLSSYFEKYSVTWKLYYGVKLVHLWLMTVNRLNDSNTNSEKEAIEIMLRIPNCHWKVTAVPEVLIVKSSGNLRQTIQELSYSRNKKLTAIAD